MNGWQAVVDNHGIEALVAVLLDAPVEASECLKQISQTLEGSRAILARSQDVLMQLAKACQVCPHSDCPELGSAQVPDLSPFQHGHVDPRKHRGVHHFCRY